MIGFTIYGDWNSGKKKKLEIGFDYNLGKEE